MKKFSFLFLFALLFAFVLVGCGEKEDAEYTVAFTGTIGTTIESQTVKETLRVNIWKTFWLHQW